MHLQNTVAGENATQHYHEYSFVCLVFLSQCAVLIQMVTQVLLG